MREHIHLVTDARIRSQNVLHPAFGAGKKKYKKIFLNDRDFMNKFKIH